MKQRNVIKSLIYCLSLVLGLMSIITSSAASQSQFYESYFMYLWSDPHEEEPAFSEDFQGISHDPDNWFVSQALGECGEDSDGVIWKIPVKYDLGSVTGSESGVYGMQLSRDEPELHSFGYWHIGDIDYYKGFIVAPVMSCNPQNYPHAIMLFRGEDFKYIGRAEISGWQDLGWVAVNPANGHVYTSPDRVNYIEEYRLDPDWVSIPINQNQPVQLTLIHIATIPLYDENGNLMDTLHNTQGGVFSERGSMFYFQIGIHNDLYPTDGLHAFDTGTWRRVMRSVRAGTTACEQFWYFWNPEWSGGWDEPEGIDVWDLDDDPRTNVWGQLHVGMVDNDIDQDDLTIYHYTRTIYADSSYTGNEQGHPSYPFNTISEAYNLACNGAWIKIKAGSYPEALTLSKQVRLVAQGGTATIGNVGRISLTTSGSVNIYSGGILRNH
jgi:hypothetical protein